jgi:hypothetical protein
MLNLSKVKTRRVVFPHRCLPKYIDISRHVNLSKPEISDSVSRVLPPDFSSEETSKSA